MDAIVKFNISGKQFIIPKDTILKYPNTYLEKIISGKFKTVIIDGGIYISASSEIFEYIHRLRFSDFFDIFLLTHWVEGQASIVHKHLPISAVGEKGLQLPVHPARYAILHNDQYLLTGGLEGTEQ